MFGNGNGNGAWLGQVPLVLGPSSWGAPGIVGVGVSPNGTPPYYGEWGVHVGDGVIGLSGRVGPFNTIDEAFSEAARAAGEAGATALPTDGFAQVVDSRGQAVGPII